MTKEDIQKILNNWDYQTALAAYLPYCSNASLKKLLESSANSPNTFTIKKLRQGLRDLMDTADAEPSNVNLRVDNLPAQRQSHTLKEAYHSAPPEVQLKISERIHLVAEARLLKHQLTQLDDLERRDAVLKIAENWQKAQACYEYEQYWEQYKELPPVLDVKKEIVLPEDNFEKLKRFKTLKTYKGRSSWPKYQDEYTALELKLKEIGAI